MSSSFNTGKLRCLAERMIGDDIERKEKTRSLFNRGKELAERSKSWLGEGRKWSISSSSASKDRSKRDVEKMEAKSSQDEWNESAQRVRDSKGGKGRPRVLGGRRGERSSVPLIAESLSRRDRRDVQVPTPSAKQSSRGGSPPGPARSKLGPLRFKTSRLRHNETMGTMMVMDLISCMFTLFIRTRTSEKAFQLRCRGLLLSSYGSSSRAGGSFSVSKACWRTTGSRVNWTMRRSLRSVSTICTSDCTLSTSQRRLAEVKESEKRIAMSKMKIGSEALLSSMVCEDVHSARSS